MLSGFQKKMNVATAYNAADPVSQELSGWHPRTESIDSAWLPNRARSTARLRDLVRNDGWAAGGINKYVDSVIGADLRLSAKPDYKVLGLSHDWSIEYSEYVEGQWRAFSNDVGRYSDAARQNTMGGLFALAFRHKLLEGDALAVAHHLPGRGGKFNTAIQVVHPDRLCNENGLPDTNIIRGGVERGPFGGAAGYWFKNTHPAETTSDYKWTRMNRETKWGRPIVIHDFNKEGAGQTRGIGVLVPVVERLKMLTKMDKAELKAAVLNATLATYITSPFDHSMVEQAFDTGEELSAYQSGRQDFHEESNLRLDGARLPILFPGEDIKGLDFSRPSTAFADFEAQCLRNVASGIGISYEQLSSDWSKVNYSSARASLLEVWRGFNRAREEFAQGFCAQIYAVFLEELFDRGGIPLPKGAPDFYAEKSSYCRSKWIGPPRGWVDPVKEPKGAGLRMSIGLSTLEAECAEQGKDWEEVIVQRAREHKKWKEAGLPDPQINEEVSEPQENGDENAGN